LLKCIDGFRLKVLGASRRRKRARHGENDRPELPRDPVRFSLHLSQSRVAPGLSPRRSNEILNGLAAYGRKPAL